MQEPIHSMNALFDQLGLSSSDDAIDVFIEAHRPIPSRVKLHDANFWNPAQASVLKQLKDEDADWAIFVDELDTLLR